MADRYFLNVGTNFNTTANWSTTSGGGAGASVPTSFDKIILDANSGNLSLEIAIHVKGISMTAGYTGTFTQNAYIINIGRTDSATTTWNMDGGTFVGSASNIIGVVDHKFIMTGGTFTSTSGSYTVGGTSSSSALSFSVTGGVFNHNNGKVIVLCLKVTKIENLNTHYLWDLEINNGTPYSIHGQIYVENSLTITSTATAGTSLLICNLRGNFIKSSSIGSINVVFEGTGTQTISVADTIQLAFNEVTINKASGVLSVLTSFAVWGHWTHTAGSINWNNNTLIFRANQSIRTITNGSFHHLERNNSLLNTLSAGTPIQCEGDFILNATGTATTFPAVKFKGNLSILSSIGSVSGITFNGTGAQSLTSSVASYDLGSIDINKSAGTVTLMSNFSMIGSTNDMNLISGIFNQNGFNFVITDTLNQTGGIYNQGAGTLDLFRYVSTLGTFNEGSQGIICRGTDFNIGIAVIFNRSLIGGGLFANTAVGTALLLTTNGWTLSNFSFARLTASLTLGSSLAINGYYKKSSTATTANVIGAGFMVRIGGDVEQNNLYSSRVLATSPTFIFNGVSDQTVTASDGKLDSGIWQVNKPSGKVSQLSNITIDNGQAGDNGLNNLVIFSGAWCTNNFNLTVDGTIIVLSSAELRKTPTSVITGALAGVITNVSSCDEKKTAFFLVD